ncbi:MAG: SET domain-containing protein-lysine N-methyltransferase [Candidatus Binatia bacterium]
MKKSTTIVLTCFIVSIAWSTATLRAAEAPDKPGRLLKINKELDKRTVIKKSLIPGSGNGLFAVVKIKKGEVIGELGGRLLEEFPEGNHYVGALIECAQKEAHPYKYLDSKDHGANVSRINFAPSKINGIETHFQNAGIKRLCKHPYFEFVALNDIKPGEEIWSSYGPNYDYDRFMKAPEVRDFFCGLLKIDCREKYSYEH